MHVDAGSMPSHQSVDSEGVTQVVGPSPHSTTERLKSQAAQHAADNARRPTDGQCPAIRTNQQWCRRFDGGDDSIS